MIFVILTRRCRVNDQFDISNPHFDMSLIPGEWAKTASKTLTAFAIHR
jgi:hypothetical protein